jgi:tetratricopeptide (TPR) repeat protein
MREVGDEHSVAVILNGAGYAAILRGAYDEARTSLEESLGIGRRLRDAFRITVALKNLGEVAVYQGRYADALPLFDEVVRLCSSRGDRRIGSGAILGLAAAHAALANLELAVKLDAIAKAVLATTGIVEPAVMLDRLEPYLRTARERVDPAIVAALAEQGPLTMDTAIAELEWHAEHAAAVAELAPR